MDNIVTLKSFPFDSMKVLNEESGQMEDDRLYEAEIFRKYFAKFLSNGVYFGQYKNYGENSMKVTLDGGLNIRVATGAGIIEGADFENEGEKLFTLERPVAEERIDSVIVKFDKTLATRETQLYIKEGNGTTPAVLQRDDNIYEICLAEVTVKSTTNISEADIKDTRLDKNLCGIVNSLISIDGKEIYQRFKEYVDSVTDNLVRKDQDSVINGKLTANQFIGYVKGEVDGNAKTATNATKANNADYATNSGTASSCTGNAATASVADSAKKCIGNSETATNSTKLGGKAASEYTTKDRFKVLTGTITTPSKDSDELTGAVEINYPSGFTKENCAIISLMMHNQKTNYKDYWSLTTLSKDSLTMLFGNNGSAVLKTDKIRIYSNKVSSTLESEKISYKLVLMRTD